MSKDTGGPAFPHEYFDAQLNKNRVMAGMTLRDYFAAKALQGMLAARENYPTDDLARYAYQVADSMLETRGEG